MHLGQGENFANKTAAVCTHKHSQQKDACYSRHRHSRSRDSDF